MGGVAVERLIFARGKLESILAPLVLAAVTAQATGTIVAWRIENAPRLGPDPPLVDVTRAPVDLPAHVSQAAPAVHSYATVRRGGLSVTGPRSIDSVREALKTVSFEGCTIDPSLRSVAARGLVGVDFTIDRAGRVVSVRDASSTTLDLSGRACAARSFHGMHSMGTAEDDTLVTYTVTSFPVRPRRAEFDRGAAAAALAAVDVRACKGVDGPSFSGHVNVAFAPAGTVTSVDLDQGPFVATRASSCIVRRFSQVVVPSFAGSPVVVGTSFSMN